MKKATLGFDNWVIAVSFELHEVIHKEILMKKATQSKVAALRDVVMVVIEER